MKNIGLLNTLLAVTSLASVLGCSGGDDGSGPGASGPDEDFMEVSLDGRVIPTEPDPMTFAAYTEEFISIGMQAPAPGGGFLDDDLVINLTTNGIVEGTYAFALDRNLRDLRKAGTLAATAAVFDFDGTEYESTLDGSLIVDGISTGEDDEGRLALHWVTGTFSGTFKNEAGAQRTASVRWAYTSVE